MISSASGKLNRLNPEYRKLVDNLQSIDNPVIEIEVPFKGSTGYHMNYEVSKVVTHSLVAI